MVRPFFYASPFTRQVKIRTIHYRLALVFAKTSGNLPARHVARDAVMKAELRLLAAILYRDLSRVWANVTADPPRRGSVS